MQWGSLGQWVSIGHLDKSTSQQAKLLRLCCPCNGVRRYGAKTLGAFTSLLELTDDVWALFW